MEDTTSTQETKSRSRSGAFLVGAGILLSRLAGLVRERVFAHYFGNSDAADVFKAALRIPNFLQNLFGEGVLSASFIPVYAKLHAEGKEDEARDVAICVGMLLLAVVCTLVTVGVFATPQLIDLIAPGFEGEKRLAAIDLVRILFPGMGLLVMSAWCLGILNSHGKFFLSYSAPVLWNLAIITVLLFAGSHYAHYELAMLAGWGVVAGSFLQTVVQIPAVLTLLQSLKADFTRARKGVRKVLTQFGPVVLGRGVVQISAYIDSIFASLLPTGAVAALAYAQTIYLLPISLFGMAISAASLPEMSRNTGTADEICSKLSAQLNHALSRICFFIIPSTVALFGIGDSITTLLFQTGKFRHDDTLYIWGILACASLGLLAATRGRLYASAFYAMHNTKTPFWYSVIRVSLTILLGYFCSMHLPALMGIDNRWGVAGLMLSSGLAGWIEYYLLKRSISNQIGITGVPVPRMTRIWIASFSGLCLALVFRYTVIPAPTFLNAGITVVVFGAGFFGSALLLRLEEAKNILQRLSGSWNQ